MLSRLPYELVCEIFANLPTPGDYFHLSTTCKRLYAVGSVDHCRAQFILAYFSPEKAAHAASSFKLICSLIATSGVKPTDHSFSATAPRIGTRKLCDFYETATAAAKSNNDDDDDDDGMATWQVLLNLFTTHCERGEWTVPALPMDTPLVIASARATARHLTQDGPRRVFVDVKMHDSERRCHRHYHCVFHLVDTIVAFDNHGHMRKGRILYRDEDVLDTTDWRTVFDAERVVGLVAPAAAGSKLNNNPLYRSPKPAPKLGRRNTPEHWEPCKLRTFENCRIKTHVCKGNLSPGDYVDRVNMYEHGEGDMICLEFLNSKHKRRGFLLLSEDSVLWDAV